MSDSSSQIIAEGLRKRRDGSDERFLSGAERVDIKYVNNLKFEVKKNNFQFLVDEPVDRGGTNTAPNPLAYFLTGVASCLMMQYVRLATANSISIDSFKLTARGHFSRRIHGAFNEIVFDVWIQSKEDRSTIVNLSKEAEELCIAQHDAQGWRKNDN